MSVFGLHITYLLNGAEDGTVLQRLSAALERSGDEMRDFRRHLWPRVIAAFEAEERRQFDAEGGGPSGPWTELSPRYAAWKAQNYPGKPLLQREGHMFEALTDSNAPFAERESTGEELTFGTQGLPYPSYHQLGPRARPVIDLSPDFEADLQQALEDSTREAMRVARLDEVAEVA